MAEQIKNSFDTESLKKIVRSFLYCCVSGLGAGLVAYSQTRNVEMSIITGLGAFGTMILTITKEFKTGETQ